MLQSELTAIRSNGEKSPSKTMDVSQLEPADRNPKREITTLFILLAVALIAGSIIVFQYIRTTKRHAEEQGKGRAPEIGELTKNYSFVDIEGKKGTFFDFTGKATLIACFAPLQWQDSNEVIKALKEFEARYKEDDRVQFLLLSMQPEGEVDKQAFKKLAEQKGTLGGKWNYAFSNGDPFLAYAKNQLKFIHLAKVKKEEKYIVPERIRILAPDLKLRGKADEYDLGKWRYDQEKAVEKLKDDPKFKNDPAYQGDFLIDYGKSVMTNNLDYMLANEEFDKAKIDESKKRNIYKPYLWLFAGFIVFLVVLGLKVKRSKAN